MYIEFIIFLLDVIKYMVFILGSLFSFIFFYYGIILLFMSKENRERLNEAAKSEAGWEWFWREYNRR